MKPDKLSPDEPAPVAELSAEIRTTPTQRNPNPVDLDAWLDLRWGSIGKILLSNRQYLAQVGNTFGSHVDLDVLPSVAASRAATSEAGGVPHDMITGYLMHVAEASLSLSKAILHNWQSAPRLNH